MVKYQLAGCSRHGYKLVSDFFLPVNPNETREEDLLLLFYYKFITFFGTLLIVVLLF